MPVTPWRYTCRDRLEQEEGEVSLLMVKGYFDGGGMHPLSKG